jgi:hypothetical protein
MQPEDSAEILRLLEEARDGCAAQVLLVRRMRARHPEHFEETRAAISRMEDEIAVDTRLLDRLFRRAQGLRND